MDTIRTKVDVGIFIQELKRKITEENLGTFAFIDSKNNYIEQTTQLRYFDNKWSALYSSEHNSVEWIEDIKNWVWNRRKDINKELKEDNFSIPLIKFTPTFEPTLRRKGQGGTQRPVCPQCNEDMDRSSVRKWNGKTSPYISNGWECQKCHVKIWDE